MIKKLNMLSGIAAICFFFIPHVHSQEFKPIYKKRSFQNNQVVNGTKVGTGWSTKNDPKKAVEEAFSMAMNGNLDESPEFAVVFASSGSRMQSILLAINELFGGKTKIYGGSSDSRAVMINKGYIKASKRAYEYAKMEGEKCLAVMTVSSEKITFGVGSADCNNHVTVKNAGSKAIVKAINSAGKKIADVPQAILLTAPSGQEEETIIGIEEVVGNNVPILGGTAGGPAFASFGTDSVYEKGISLAVIYTDLKVGWRFEGGFDVKDRHSGIVTKVNGQHIEEIDNRPALDVYDEWLGGEIRIFLSKHKNRLDRVRELLTLHPLYRKYIGSEGNAYSLFSHPWPKDKYLIEKAISTSTKIKAGERVYLSHGTWETLLNRIGNLPKHAKENAGLPDNSSPLFAIGYICAGVMGTIPESERDKMAYLMNYSNANSPFIAPFTWGEQGYFPGVGNKHGNLCTSFLVIGKK